MIPIPLLLLLTAGPASAASSPGAGAPAAKPTSEANVPRISPEEFKDVLDKGDVVVIDVRAKEAYQAGHVPGAINAPLGTLGDMVARLKAYKKPIVAYCS